MSRPGLSIVVPVFNEAGVVVELVRRCVAAGRATSLVFEVIVVDDESRDATPQLLAQVSDAQQVRALRLERNTGQFGATCAGLRQARGEVVVVLDGDLQDPPEVIPSLVEALVEADGETDCVFAVKAKRQDPLWFRLGRYGYHAVQRVMLRDRVPSGAGSYCAMSARLAARVGRLPAQRSNLSAVVAALGARTRTVPYEKARRYDDQSRVGVIGLAREALASLLLTGAIQRLLLMVALAAALAGLNGVMPAPAALAFSAVGGSAAAWCRVKRRAFLTEAEHGYD